MSFAQFLMNADFASSDWGFLDGELYGRCWNASLTTEESAARHIGLIGPDGLTVTSPGLIKFTIDSPPFPVVWVSPDRIAIVKRGVRV